MSAPEVMIGMAYFWVSDGDVWDGGEGLGRALG